ncbi:MAG: prepilin peptidase [Culicoidibacterales bacterium]
MEFVGYGFIFYIGAVFGSFFHVVGYRYLKGLDFVKGRSQCPVCETQLQAIDLMPIFSYLLVRGKCRHCGVKIPIIYWLAEVVMGLLFVLPVLVYGYHGFLTGEVILAWLFSAMLFTITVTDIYEQLIPDKILLFFGILLVIASYFVEGFSFVEGIIGALVGFGLLYLIGTLGRLYYKQDALGGGDVKLYLVIGYVLGWQVTIFSLFVAAVLALIGAVIMRQKKGMIMPFGPFIALAAIICLYSGAQILTWYFGLF